MCNGKTVLLLHASLASFSDDLNLELHSDAAIAVEDGDIQWIGKSEAIPERYRGFEKYDVEGRLVTPGLIDCHTHLVHGGHRAREFEMRLNGASYEDVARAGGGIISTVQATRTATVEELVDSALPRLDAMIEQGVTTVEIKSGYGLERESELNMLRAARQLAQRRPIRIQTSYLGAHAVPPDYQNRADEYIETVCIPTLNAAAEEGLVDAVDGFCEGIAFSPEQIERVFVEAIKLNLPMKLHAEQLSHLGGVQLAARYGALSADHIEYANDEDAQAMGRAGTVAVLLPGAFYTLRESRMPPIGSLRKHQVPLAVATDCNPGSSPLSSLLLAMNMACTLFRMTPMEAYAGVTTHAAAALGRQDIGAIRTGMKADLAVWSVDEPAELAYRIGFNPLFGRIFGGKWQ